MFKISSFTHQIPKHVWTKSGILPQCAYLYHSERPNNCSVSVFGRKKAVRWCSVVRPNTAKKPNRSQPNILGRKAQDFATFHVFFWGKIWKIGKIEILQLTNTILTYKTRIHHLFLAKGIEVLSCLKIFFGYVAMNCSVRFGCSAIFVRVRFGLAEHENSLFGRSLLYHYVFSNRKVKFFKKKPLSDFSFFLHNMRRSAH